MPPSNRLDAGGGPRASARPLLLVALLLCLGPARAWGQGDGGRADAIGHHAGHTLGKDAGSDRDGGALAADDERTTLADRARIEPLPAVEPDPGIAAVVARADRQTAAPAPSIPPQDRPEAVIKVILGLFALMALAYLGGHRRVLEWEKRLGVSQVITAGLPFVLLGVIARQPTVGILTDRVLAEIGPLLRVGLGAIGFVAGFRFETKSFQGLPKEAASVALLSTLLPAAAVAAATAPLLLAFSPTSWSSSLHDPVFLRDALILATAGAMTARSTVRWHGPGGDNGLAARIIRIEEFAGVLGLAAVAAFFRVRALDGSWQLPGMVWLLLTLGLGTALGLLFYAVMVATRRKPDFLTVTIGAIAFAAGAAGYLYLSSVAVAFVAGVIVANFPGDFQPHLREMLKRLERPIYLLSLLVIGALWDVEDWRGWVLMPVFMVSRLMGKGIAATLAVRQKYLPVSEAERRSLAVSPVGALAIAIVVNAQLLYPGGSIALVVSAVVGGAMLTEAFVQLAARRAIRRGSMPQVAQDDEPSAERAPTEAREP